LKHTTSEDESRLVETLLQLNDKKELGAYYESKGDLEKAIESYSKGNAWHKVADLVVF